VESSLWIEVARRFRRTADESKAATAPAPAGSVPALQYLTDIVAASGTVQTSLDSSELLALRRNFTNHLHTVFSFLKNRRRDKVRQQQFPNEWEQVLQDNVAVYSRLTHELHGQLKELILVFLDEKRFEGCGSLEVTDEMRVTIAGQACLLLLNRETDFFPALKTILLYPSSYVHPEKEEESHDVEGAEILGESWQYGPVVLSWDSARHGAVNQRDGENVVLHEFAHQLDQIDGEADGAPKLGRGLSLRERLARYKTWSAVFQREFDAHRDRVDSGRRTVIDEYGATNPAEFFATATEAFFEKSRALQKKHPELYRELKTFYRLDPIEWSGGAGD
jgi:Mlc titration factor MtfA (ptsG expression regulator)